MDNRPIGVFDSGVGGLTVAHEIQKLMPHERIVYAGDTARVPYGGKNPETLLVYAKEIIRYLISGHDVKAVVIACGTVSSNIYDRLCAIFPDLTLVDVIQPGVRACLDTNPQKVGFIATEATVRSGLFARLLAERGIDVESRACPLFVPLVEEGWVNNPVTRLVAETYLEGWHDLDTLVLGCTHYPLLAGLIKHVMGDINIINMAEYTANELLAALVRHNQTAGKGSPVHEYYVSGYTDKFERMLRLILNHEGHARQVDWTEKNIPL
jgi:glutamate racemase